jgi:dihydroorotase
VMTKGDRPLADWRPDVYCGPVLRHPTALIQAAKDSSPTFALATRS